MILMHISLLELLYCLLYNGKMGTAVLHDDKISNLKQSSLNDRIMHIMYMCMQLHSCGLPSDLQPPVVRLTSYPPAVSNKGQFTFSFNCLNEWQCSFMCSVHTVGHIPQYSSCNGSFTTQTLTNGGHYEFAVKATDGVGNVGEKEDFQWMIGMLKY